MVPILKLNFNIRIGILVTLWQDSYHWARCRCVIWRTLLGDWYIIWFFWTFKCWQIPHLKLGDVSWTDTIKPGLQFPFIYSALIAFEEATINIIFTIVSFWANGNKSLFIYWHFEASVRSYNHHVGQHDIHLPKIVLSVYLNIHL